MITKLTDAQYAEQLAYDLGCQMSERHFAWVRHKDVVYFSQMPFELCNQWRGLISPTTRLIQTLFENYVDLSFFILRNRIWTTAEMSEFDRGMVRIAAKRVTDKIKPVCHQQETVTQLVLVGSEEQIFFQSCHYHRLPWQWQNPIQTDEQAVHALEDLLKKVQRGTVLHDFERAIAAILVDQKGQMIAYDSNTNSKNKTLHAEVNLVQTFLQKRVRPAGPVTLYVSLKPCLMCSSLLKAYFGDQLSVVYFESDKSRAKPTVLDMGQRIRQANTKLSLNWNLC